MIAGYRIEGHAIVSADDRIAGPDGRTPAALRNDADWHNFQSALDAAAAVLLGRRGHEHNPNDHNRNRIVVSSSAAGIERRADAWWWNPAKIPLSEALAVAVPSGGTIAVPGGRPVFDLMLQEGFDSFHLARAAGVRVPGGVPLFSAIDRGLSAEDILRSAGLVPAPSETLDAAAGVTLTIWGVP